MRATGFWHRLWALVKKEFHQMLRDRSNLLVGLALPVTLILLFGYGMSFDVKDVRVAMVLEDASPRVQQVLAGLRGSTYMEPRWAGSMPEAEQWLRRHEVEAILRVPSDFSGRLQTGDATAQLVVNGSESTSAATIESYVNGVLALWAQKEADRAGPAGQTVAAGSVQVQQRLWFNEAGESTWFLVPGLLVLVLTLIGAFLTSLLIAREWERGTMESLFVTPVRPLEIVLAKLIPYVGVGLVDLAMCLLAAHFLFEVPMRGSLGMMVLGGHAVPGGVAADGALHFGAHAQPVPGQSGGIAGEPAAVDDAVGFHLRPAQRTGTGSGHRAPAAGHALHGADQEPVPDGQPLADHRAGPGHSAAVCGAAAVGHVAHGAQAPGLIGGTRGWIRSMGCWAGCWRCARSGR